MNSIQELASAVSNIDWSKLQSDSVEDNERMNYLKGLVLRLNKIEAVDLLFEIMEARGSRGLACTLQFNRMNHAYNSFVPGNWIKDSSEDDRDSWHDLCIKLDTMARYRDSIHFGLPMGDIYDLINSVNHEFKLERRAKQ